MKKNAVLACFLAFIACVSTAYAEAKSVVVVELFTSQGCSACPPADAVLQDLAEKPHVLALAFHVDYWDYIGWKDTFAQPVFTQRQKTYAKRLGRKHVYTPQMIINGHHDVIGSHAMEIGEILSDESKEPQAAMIESLAKEGEISLLIKNSDNSRPTPQSEILVIRFRAASQVEIKKGENKGRTLSYSNIVTSVSKIGNWRGTGTWKASYASSGTDKVAIIVQGKNQGRIYGSAILP